MALALQEATWQGQ